jgi:hypothetical protein
MLKENWTILWEAVEKNVREKYPDAGVLGELGYTSKDWMTNRPIYDSAASVDNFSFYFHSHDCGDDIAGHFHIFKNQPNQVIHFGGLELNKFGIPHSFFIVEPWVTGEKILPAQKMLDEFRSFYSIKNFSAPGATIHNWLGLTLKVIEQEIAYTLMIREENIELMSFEPRENSSGVFFKQSLLRHKFLTS